VRKERKTYRDEGVLHHGKLRIEKHLPTSAVSLLHVGRRIWPGGLSRLGIEGRGRDTTMFQQMQHDVDDDVELGATMIFPLLESVELTDVGLSFIGNPSVAQAEAILDVEGLRNEKRS
jgi:hypothetical protein